jgi:hypothetical protein
LRARSRISVQILEIPEYDDGPLAGAVGGDSARWMGVADRAIWAA